MRLGVLGHDLLLRVERRNPSPALEIQQLGIRQAKIPTR